MYGLGTADPKVCRRHSPKIYRDGDTLPQLALGRFMGLLEYPHAVTRLMRLTDTAVALVCLIPIWVDLCLSS